MNSGNFARRLFLGTKCLLLPMTYLPVRRVTQNASWPSADVIDDATEQDVGEKGHGRHYP